MEKKFYPYTTQNSPRRNNKVSLVMKSFSSRNSKARASLSMKRKSNIKIDYVTINDDESRFPNIGESWHTNCFLKVNKDPKRIGNNPRIYELHSLANTFDEMSLKEQKLIDNAEEK